MTPTASEKRWTAGTHYLCPECHKVSESERWVETEVGCEDCGSHPGLRCPECEEAVDLVMRDEEELVFTPKGVPDGQ